MVPADQQSGGSLHSVKAANRDDAGEINKGSALLLKGFSYLVGRTPLDATVRNKLYQCLRNNATGLEKKEWSRAAACLHTLRGFGLGLVARLLLSPAYTRRKTAYSTTATDLIMQGGRYAMMDPYLINATRRQVPGRRLAGAVSTCVHCCFRATGLLMSLFRVSRALVFHPQPVSGHDVSVPP